MNEANKEDKNKGKKNNISNINNNEEKNKSNINLSQISNKNFNETLFDYKRYSFLNNNPHKRKSEFDEDLKNLKKAKDLLIKIKKKGWIKKTFINKEKSNGDKKDENKIMIDKIDNNKNSCKLSSKLNFTNLNIINEEESNKKVNNKNGLNNLLNNNEEEKKDDSDSENDYGEINMFNKIFKKSQDDFGVNLVKEKESKKSFKCSNSSFSISKFRDYLKNKNPGYDQSLGGEIEEFNTNKRENELKFIEDKNIIV